jgi:ABC-type Fe3+-hydroxamate transport system substrate-binding protein
VGPCSAPYHAAARAVAILCMAAALACGTDETREKVPEAPPPPPPRMLSLAPGLSALLVELGVADGVVGADTASRALPELAASADLGALDENALALAASLRPDFALFLGDEAPPFARALEARGVRSVVFSPRSANDVVDTVRRLGTLLGRETRAAMVSARLTREVASYATRRDGRERLAVAWLLRRDPPTVVGGTGLLHELLELAGAENAFHGPPGAPTAARVVIRPEELRDERIDVVLDASGARGSALATDARVLRVAPELAALPTLDLIARVAGLYALLYPDEGDAAAR